MRIRPFFWLLLFLSSASVLTLAVFYQVHVPSVLQALVIQPSPVTNGMTSLDLHLTDPQGTPIDQAQVVPSARMTNMDMASDASYVIPLGNGRYKVQVHLYMSGPWAITINASADGFTPLQRTLTVQVT